MNREKKSLAEIAGGLTTSLSKTSFLPEKKQEKAKEKIMFEVMDDLIGGVINISQEEIIFVSTGVKALCAASCNDNFLEVNNTLQKFLLFKASSEETKEFVRENMY